MKRALPIVVALLVAAACGDAEIGSTFPDSFPTTTRNTLARDPFFVPAPTGTAPAGAGSEPGAPPRTTPPGTPPSDEILATSPAGGIRIGGELVAEFIEVGERDDTGRLEVIGVFGPASGVVVPVGDDGEPTEEILVIEDDVVTYTAEGVEFTRGDGQSLTAAGLLLRVEDVEDVAFELRLGRGAGSTVIALDGDRAVVSGQLGRGTLDQIVHLVNWHPEVGTLVLANVPGSVDPDAVFAAGRLLREVGLATEVPADGFVAGGGVDLFAAGAARTLGEGASLAVRAWEDPADDVRADRLPPGDDRHDPFLTYLAEMLGDVAGPDFYFFSINAAAPDELHLMSDAEIARYKLVTVTS